jgi:hypothetical protein
MEKVIETPDIFTATKKYVNQWVALSKDYKKVIASGKTLAEVLKKTSSEKRVMVFKVPSKAPYFTVSDL